MPFLTLEDPNAKIKGSRVRILLTGYNELTSL